MMDPLSLVATDDLLAEVIGRFDHAIFAGMRINQDGSENHGYVRTWNGNSHACMGLAADLTAKVLAAFRTRELAEEN